MLEANGIVCFSFEPGSPGSIILPADSSLVTLRALHSRSQWHARAVSILFYLLWLSGCSILEIRSDLRIADNIGAITGAVELSTPSASPIIVRRYHLDNGVYVLDNFARASSDGSFRFNCLPGDYFIAAFVDINHDGEYQQELEPANYYSTEFGQPAAISVNPSQTISIHSLTIAGKLTRQVSIKTRIELVDVVKNTGTVTTLDDPTFSGENYTLGIWKPLRFLQQVGGGLLFLQPYQQDRIPVLFIHGLNGGPAIWANVVKKLDRRLFQPWVLYYPSGMRLTIISEFLANAVATVQDRYNFDKIFIVAHSMGGLIAHAFVYQYLDRYPNLADNIGTLITVNSPMQGVNSAALGVRNSPIVVPAWRDIATDSDFMKRLHSRQWSDQIPYYLVFSYQDGSSDDGTISLQSQIPLELQKKATRIYGFNENHTKILENSAFISLFNSILTDSIN